MTKFIELNLNDKLQAALLKLGYTEATEVQAQAFSIISEGKDLIASSQTGTGKTGAFLIPLINTLEAQEGDDKSNILIVTPTRELAKQVLSVAMEMTSNNSEKFPLALLIGGDDIGKQLRQLKKNPRIVVGTPGRINDHLEKRRLKLHKTRHIVLDETDRMLDMGFGVQIDAILSHMLKEKQTILFSATFPKAIVKIANTYLNNPEKITVGKKNVAIESVEQSHIHTNNKFETLTDELEKTSGSILVFARTQRNTETIKDKLKGSDYKADVIHGGMRQNARERVMQNFRKQKYDILIATDVASRGIDIDHIEHVINYDLPDNPEDYVHRIGRTGRNGRVGKSVSFISNSEKHKWKAVQNFLNGEEEEMPLSNGKRPRRRSSGGRPSGGAGSGRRRDSNASRGRDGNFGGSRDGANSGAKRRFSNDRNDRNDRGFSGKRNSEGGSGFDRRKSSDGRRSGKPSFGKNTRRTGERNFKARRSSTSR